MTEREQLHQIVDELPENELAVARKVLRALVLAADAVELSFLSAPADDETSEIDQDGVDEALREIESGQAVSADEARRILEVA